MSGLSTLLLTTCLPLPVTMTQVVRSNQAYSFSLDAGPSSDPLVKDGITSIGSPGLLHVHAGSDPEEGFKTESGGDIQHEHGSGGDPVVSWPEGEHPLEGVPNFIDLPTAEPVRYHTSIKHHLGYHLMIDC